MSLVVFTDLDDTLFQTRRKLRGDEGSLVPATVDTRGEAHSFCTPPQQALLRHFQASGMTVIPVTGRDQAAMNRVTLPFTSWRVLDHGATILGPDGQIDEEWAAHVRSTLRALTEALTHCTEGVQALAASLGCRVRVHQAHGEHLMSVAKHPDAHAQALAQVQAFWETQAQGSELQVIANANNVTVLPRSPGKAQAVRYLLERHLPDASLTFGIGDSVSDLGFMNACHFAVTPPGGQLMRAATDARLPQR